MCRMVPGRLFPARGQLRDVQAVWLEHVGLGLEPAPQPGRPPAARAVKRANRGGEPALPVGQPGGEPGPGTAAFRQAGPRRSARLRLVHGEAERGQPGRAAFQRGQRRAPVPGAPQRRRPAVRAREPDPAAHRGRQRPPGERQRPDRIIRHVPQCHGRGEHYGARRRLYSHAGRYYAVATEPQGGKAWARTITHVLGARPNFVKAAPVIRALAALGHAQRVVHTGQHYDERMSECSSSSSACREPDVNLGVGSGTQATQTADVHGRHGARSSCETPPVARGRCTAT